MLFVRCLTSGIRINPSSLIKRDVLAACRSLSYGLDNPQAERALASFIPSVSGLLLPAQRGTLLAFSTSGREAEELIIQFREHAGI